MAFVGRNSAWYDSPLVDFKVYEDGARRGDKESRTDEVYLPIYTSYETPEEPVFYTVVPGDTPRIIAMKVYGDADLDYLVLHYNPVKAFYGHNLTVGDVLTLPSYSDISSLETEDYV